MIPTDGSARLLDGLELLDGKTRIVYEAYDGAGNLYTYTRNLDELADLPGGRNLADGAMDQWCCAPFFLTYNYPACLSQN